MPTFEMRLTWLGEDYAKLIRRAIYILNGGKQLALNNKNALLIFSEYFSLVQDSFRDYLKIIVKTGKKPRIKITFH